METTPDLTGEGISTEIPSADDPPNDEEVVVAAEDAEEENEVTGYENRESNPPQDKEEFNARVERLMAMMKDDPDVRDRILAETYVNIASAEMGIRGIVEVVQSQGVAGLMKGAFSRGR